MYRFAVIAVAVLALTGFPGQMSQTALAGGPHHEHMHHALREMREAHRELKEAKHDFGGHREQALKALDAAIHQTDKALKAVGDNIRGEGKVDPGIYKKYGFHPHMHHAIHEMREAHRELREAKHDFKGHREKALHDIDHAIKQTELALKFAKK